MRLAALSAAIGGLAIVSSSFGALTFTTQTIPGTGNFAGMDRVNLILSSTTEDYSVAVVSVDMTTTAAGGLKFRVPTVGNADIQAPGLEATFGSSFNPGVKGTFGGLSPDFGAIFVATPENNAASKPLYAAGLPTVNFISLLTSALPLTKTETPGGIVIASAVVASGSTVVFGGSVAPDLATSTIPTPIVIPEPATLGAMGIAALGLVRRRK